MTIKVIKPYVRIERAWSLGGMAKLGKTLIFKQKWNSTIDNISVFHLLALIFFNAILL
jgi:hypothetical protein